MCASAIKRHKLLIYTLTWMNKGIILSEKSQSIGGAWVVQLFERLSLNFSARHDLGVLGSGSSPESGSTLSLESLESLSLSLCPYPLLMLSQYI